MIFIVFVFISILFVVALNVKRPNRKINISFMLFKTKQKVSLYKEVAKIIEKKINRRIKVFKVIDKKLFISLGLIEAPVYVIDVKRLGVTHANLILKSTVFVRQKFNLVLLNSGKALKSFGYVNLVTITEKQLTYRVLSLLNCLNVNKRKEDCDYECEYDYKLNNLKYDFEKNSLIGELDNCGVYKLDLPKSCFGYILNKKTKQVCDVFGSVLLEFESKAQVEVSNNDLLIYNKKTCTLILKIYYNLKMLQLLDLLKLDISMEGYTGQIAKLKQKAMEQLSNVIINDIELNCVKVTSLNNFFKIAFLRKEYLNDYLSLLINVLGINLNGGILKVSPSVMVKGEFFVNYIMNGEKFSISYTDFNTDKVKLSHVGHKMGVKDKFVYGY